MSGPDPAEDVVYGLLRMADMDVALPLSALREVVPCPPELAGLPAAAPGLLGAVELRRLVLPVVDLTAVLGRPAQRRPGQVVVVATAQLWSHGRHTLAVSYAMLSTASGLAAAYAGLRLTRSLIALRDGRGGG